MTLLMLPFLKAKRSPGLIVSQRSSDGSQVENPQESEDLAIDAASADLITAMHNKDIKAVSAALKAAFEILDSQPHVEGPHMGEDY